MTHRAKLFMRRIRFYANFKGYPVQTFIELISSYSATLFTCIKRWDLHSVSELKKLYSNFGKFKKQKIVGFFRIRNEFVNVQGNKKCNTQNIQVKKQQKKMTI